MDEADIAITVGLLGITAGVVYFAYTFKPITAGGEEMIIKNKSDATEQKFNIEEFNRTGIITPFQTVQKEDCPSGYYKDLAHAMAAAGGGTGTWRFETAPGTTCMKAYLVIK